MQSIFWLFTKVLILHKKIEKYIMSNAIKKVPSWLMIAVFLLIVVILGVFTDLFTFIVGSLIMIGIFASGYDSENLHEH